MSKRQVPLIVHVDDRETKRYTVRKLLETAGFEVEQAANGSEGLNLITDRKPDLVILDVKLPDVSGFDVCRRIKTTPEIASIPVMHLSAHFTESEFRVEGLDSGADAYLTSINSSELIATVRALLRAKQAEDKALASAAEWQTTFDSVSDPILILDNHCTIIRSNAAAVALLDNGAARKRLMDHLAEACSKSDAGTEYMDRTEFQADHRIYRLSMDRVNAPDETPAGCVCVLADITEFKTAEREIRRMNEQLQFAKDAAVQADRAKSTFLAGMSHELRTPLNAIMGYTEMLEEEANQRNDETAVQDLGKITLSARHLLNMVTEILDLSRIEAGRSEVHIEEFDLMTIIRDAVSMTTALAERNNNRIEVTCGDSLIIRSDSPKLYQVLLNLLSNACKFTSGGTIRVRCSTSQVEGTDWIRVEVEDSGIGIEANKLGSIFDAYEQAETDARYVYGGTGLGLSISRRLVELLGGTLGVVSTRGTGSIFSVFIPTNLSGGMPPRSSIRSPLADK